MSKQQLLLVRQGHISKRSCRSCITSDKNFKKLYYRSKKHFKLSIESLGCCYHKSSIKFQPENSFVSREAMERRSVSCEMRVTRTWLSARPLTQTAIRLHNTVEASFKFLKTVDILWKCNLINIPLCIQQGLG